MKDMSAVNEARRAALATCSPLERGRQKDRSALLWLWRWGWSTSTTTDLAVTKQRGVVKRLVDQKMIEYHETEGYRDIYYPARLAILTKKGCDLLGETCDLSELKRPTIENVPTHQLRHDHAVQFWTAKKLREGVIKNFITPREMARKSTNGAKQPDVIWIMPDGSKIGLEIELTYKKAYEKHMMVSKMTALLESGAVDSIIIVTRSEATAKEFLRLIAPGAVRARWRRWQRKYELVDGVDDVAPGWLIDKITIELLP